MVRGIGDGSGVLSWFQQAATIGSLAVIPVAITVILVAFRTLFQQSDSLEDQVRERTEEYAVALSRIEAILEGVGEGLVVTDRDRRVRLCNRVALEMLKVGSKDLIGQLWPEFVLPGGGETVKKIGEYPISRAIREDRLVDAGIDEAIWFQGRRESPFAVRVTVAPLRYGGKTHGAVVVFRDASEEVAIDRVKTEFVSLASQWATPLSAMNWYTEVLAEEVAAAGGHPEWVEYLSVLHRSSQRLVAMVNSLLNISRIDSGRVNVDPAPVSLKAVLGEQVSDLRGELTDRKMTVRTDFHGQEDIMVVTDRQIAGIVMLNLIANAVKYSPDGSEILVEMSPSDDGGAVMTVTDRTRHPQEEPEGYLHQAVPGR